MAYIRHINEALAGRPEGMAVTTHMCRGNFRSSWAAEGGYDFVAEALFGELDVDGFFLEYDDARSGGFEPLRFVPPGKQVVLGLVTTKRGALETKDDLKRRIERGLAVRPRRPALPVAAVRVLLDRRGQHADGRRGDREAAADRRDGRRGLGLGLEEVLDRCAPEPGLVEVDVVPGVGDLGQARAGQRLGHPLVERGAALAARGPHDQGRAADLLPVVPVRPVLVSSRAATMTGISNAGQRAPARSSSPVVQARAHRVSPPK